MTSSVRVGVAAWSHLNLKCFPEIRTHCSAGVELDILETILTLSNLTMSLVISNEPACGKTPLETGRADTWTGLMKMLQDGQIDVIGNLCNLNKLSGENQTFFSMSMPVWQYEEQFLIQAPELPPLSFAPLAPFRKSIWVAIMISFCLHLALITTYSYLRYGSSQKIYTRIFRAMFDLFDVCFNFKKAGRLSFVGPFWLVVITWTFMFYKSYILCVSLYPFPLWRPFSDIDGLAAALESGEYRLVSFKDPPAIPGGCTERKCGERFRQAIQEYGFRYVPRASGYDMVSVIAEQDTDIESEPKLVLVDGAPFISLYLSEYPYNRDQLWLIDEVKPYEKRSGYVWRKNFTFEDQLNMNLIQIGEFKQLALTRHINDYGPDPRTGDRITETAPIQEPISLSRFRGLFYLLFAGAGLASVTFIVEVAFARYNTKGGSCI